MLKIGIFGHVGNKNLGDEAIISAVIDNIRIRLPQAQIIGFTTNAEDTATRHNIPAHPIRRQIAGKRGGAVQAAGSNETHPAEKTGVVQQLKDWLKGMPWIFGTLKRIAGILALIKGIYQESTFLVKCHRNLEGVDLLIIAGSQQLIDYVGGPWAFPYTLFKWSVIAKIIGTKVAFLSVGAGPIYTRLGRFFDKTALSLATYRSYRDDTSCRCVNQIGLKDDRRVIPDLAFSLNLDKYEKPGPCNKDSLVVGINPVPFDDGSYWIGGGRSAYQGFTETLAFFALWLIERGHKVKFFATQLILDPPVIADIRRIMVSNSKNKDIDANFLEATVRSLKELIDEISEMDVVVATRYHGVVLSYAANKPVLGIAYQPKTADLMRSMGQSDYTVDITKLEFEDMRRRFKMLENKSDEISMRINKEVSIWRKMVEDQYDHAFDTLTTANRS
jgi:polysaccharide pyruvyl transferase WcaK-like protein